MMSGPTILYFQQSGSGSGTAAQANPAPAPRTAPTRDQIREQVRQSLRDAQQAVDEATAQATAEATAEASADRPRVIINGRPVVVGPQGIPNIQVHGGGMEDGIPPQVVDMSIAFFIMLAVIIIGWPLARAMGRRIERRAETPVPDPAIAGQLQRIEQAVEAMSIEIERISESQRFMAKLQSASAPERSVLNAGERR